MSELCEVVITAPDPEWLLEITRELVNDGLCASVHNFAPIRSIYRRQGKVYERTEGRASLHTRKSRVAEIVERVKSRHPYDVPGISTRPIEDGNPEYLEWMLNETQSRLLFTLSEGMARCIVAASVISSSMFPILTMV